MAQQIAKHTSAHKRQSALERLSLSFEYNESWADARRSLRTKTSK